jgi:hypothetical protein
MFYDLNVPWSSSSSELKQRIAFLAECKPALQIEERKS